MSQQTPHTDFGLGELDPATGKYNLKLDQVDPTIDLTPYNKSKHGTGIFADPESEEFKMAAQTKASDAALAAKEASEAAQKAKYLGLLRGGVNVASKGIGLGAAAYNGYDAYAEQRDHGWKDPAVYTKGLASLGGLAAMVPGGQIIGGLAQVPEMARSGQLNLPDQTMTSKHPIAEP